jgi:hypothetical protein
MSTVPVTAIDNSAWIRDLVYLAFPEGEARERVLFDLIKQFSKMDPDDPEWLRYKLNVVECRAMENMARALNEAASEQARLRGVTREMADYASLQIRGQSKPRRHRLDNYWRMCSSVFMMRFQARPYSRATPMKQDSKEERR